MIQDLRRSSSARASFLSLALVLLWACAPKADTDQQSTGTPDPLKEHRQTQWVMGTSLEIVLWCASDSLANLALEQSFAQAHRWNGILSNYDVASDLSRLNAAGTEPVDVDDALFRYLQQSWQDAQRTGGAFDITVGPLVALHRQGRPSQPSIDRTRASVGYRKLRLDVPHTVTLSVAGMALDPGANGKGVALDAMVAVVRRLGIADAFFDFGGSSFYALGAPPNADGWQIALKGPDGEVVGEMPLRDQSLSSSATLRADASGGPRQAHLVDPRSGHPVVEDRVAAALSASATDAEVLATALAVDGNIDAPWIASFEGAQVILIVRGQAPVTRRTELAPSP